MDWLLSCVGRTVVPDSPWRDEAVAMARDASAGAGPVDRCQEIASLASFGVQQRSRRWCLRRWWSERRPHR